MQLAITDDRTRADALTQLRSSLPDSVSEKLREAESYPVSALPPKLSRYLCGDSGVLSRSEDGGRIRVCCLGTNP